MNYFDTSTIRFRFAARKAMAALGHMVGQRDGLDLHQALKACYFADKEHLNKHGRPVFGATYRAMRFGPVPVEIYEMAKGEAIWLAELGIDRFPWTLTGYRLHWMTNDMPSLDSLSASDLQVLKDAIVKSASMTFDQRTEATHQQDWQKAKLGQMRYEDMIEDGPDKAELVAYLREAGPFLRL